MSRKTKDARLNLRVPSDLLEHFKIQCEQLNTTVTQKLIDFMVSSLNSNPIVRDCGLVGDK
jgi:predicted DNA binding CopG/RHH family protein